MHHVHFWAILYNTHLHVNINLRICTFASFIVFSPSIFRTRIKKKNTFASTGRSFPPEHKTGSCSTWRRSPLSQASISAPKDQHTSQIVSDGPSARWSPFSTPCQPWLNVVIMIVGVLAGPNHMQTDPCKRTQVLKRPCTWCCNEYWWHPFA